ncbi:MAG: type II toxin-antitoxin system RelE/ParE family toxin [Tannerellaceae bacterium]|jgi:plasmid stabilization system protein ParE|nr:type II toxin-antitoxin system RelE/ParE family toxin [Tannerellaceae bacterium]
MREIRLSVQAAEDLEEIFKFYLLKSPSVAVKIHNSIIDEAQRLINWPEIGKYESMLDSYTFEFRFRSLVTSDGLFKIIYFIDDDIITISRIWCCRKNPKELRN